MTWSRVVLMAGLALTAFCAPVRAETVVSELSTESVEITSSFSGERLSFFGSIGPDADADVSSLNGPYHVIIVVIGPTTDRVAREKTHNFGVWLNTEEVRFAHFPTYYQVLTSGRLNDIASPSTQAVENFDPAGQARPNAEAGWWKSALFGRELTRLMTEQGLFGLNEGAVKFLSPTVYTSRLTLPAAAPPGRYLARTYVLKDGVTVARNTEGFTVRKIGFERFLAIQARQQPLLYGLVSVLLGLLTGWLGGVLFKRN
ncbi:TIGR02186 family protein [Devosia rhodophyticola]|uniref:TIGR02186 family protein n=1 Tax=Devosia rhodophyticola TaxID=3026423 RepID=A0ABY7Z0A5_9HYPH|nr:TIGR02186 family protein [Devosia rhodophyticola]WDR07070.1 TIGR02186 family protein [Devosia rhodophyticola]